LFLALDVGNTNITGGLFRDGELIHTWRIMSDRSKTADQYGLHLVHLLREAGVPPHAVQAAAMASVVPPLNPVLDAACRRYLGCRLVPVGPLSRTLPKIHYDDPSALGADRIVNAVAAYRKFGGPVIVIDFGTATKLECVSAEGEYLGGVIAPGIGISTEALTRSAARLQRVEPTRPKGIVGKNVVQSIQAGIVYGFAGQADGLVRRVMAEIGANGARPTVVATGGMAHLVVEECRLIDRVEPHLTLEGIRIVYEQTEG
jgi:type III pantothenate kinase